MGINLERNKNSWNVSDVINLTQTSTAGQFATAMQNIDTKLNEIKKEITYWDIYKITSAITSAEDFENKVANLEINHSTVINTTHFKRSFQGIETDFYSGDIIVRLKDGSYQHIEAANAGLYVPELKSNTDGTELTITYNYATVAPTDAQGNYQNFSTNIATLTGENSKTYGYVLTEAELSIIDRDDPFHFKAEKCDPTEGTLTPVIKFFDKDNQEVFTDAYTIRLQSETYFFYLHSEAKILIKTVVIK